MLRYDVLILVLSCITVTMGNPKKYDPEDRGFSPSNRYYEESLPSKYNTSSYQRKDGKESRFGIPIPIAATYGNTGNGVQYGSGTGGIGYMINPMKIDIGGVALGALIGLGAILIVPKLAHVFSGNIAGYRSIDDDMPSFGDILSKIDNSLEQNNIHSSSCMQRIICTYVNDAQKNMQTGEGTSVDEFITSITSNSLLTYMLDGSTIKQAIDMGKSGKVEKCSKLYSKCPLSKENIVKVISTLLPA